MLLFSGGKDSIVLLRLAEKAFRPAALPVPGHARGHGPQLPRGPRVPRPPRRGARRAADRGLRAGLDRQRPGGRGDRPARLAQPAPDGHAARRASRSTASTPPSAARAATRSAPAARSAIFCFRDDFGQWDPKASAPSCGTSTTARDQPGEHVRVFPLSNWTELDVWQYIARGGARGPVDLLRPRARGVPPRRDALRGLRPRRAAGRRGARSRNRCATGPSAT